MPTNGNICYHEAILKVINIGFANQPSDPSPLFNSILLYCDANKRIRVLAEMPAVDPLDTYSYEGGVDVFAGFLTVAVLI